MLTAEEQWRIIQEEERKTGRGRTKKKTLAEQLEDMGGFGHDPDNEQAIRNDLERMDSRHPLQSSKESIPECEASFGKSSFWESRKKLFNSWVFQANRPSSWIEKKDLPLCFRFALCRPIMDERSFQATLQAMNMQLEIPMGDVRRPLTYPIGRSRELMFGIDVDHERNVHVSNRFRDTLPKGATENMDRVREEASRIAQQDDEDMQQLTRRQLWTVYEHLQNGSVPLETATWHYRDAFDTDMSDKALFICLQHYGIPTDHIPSNERKASRGSAHSPFSSGVESLREEIENVNVPNPKEMRILKELGNYIGLYRGGAFQEHEVIPMIQHCLDGLELEANIISDILTDLEKDEETAALLMWEDAYFYASTSSSEEEKEESPEEQENTLRAVMVPDPLVNEGKGHDAAAASPVNGSRSYGMSATEDMDCRDDSKETVSEQLNATSIGQPIMSPPAVPPGKRPTYSHVNEAESGVQPTGTLMPKPASPTPATNEFDSQVDVESDGEPPRGRTNVRRRRSSSPDNGMTTGIWGLLMPTKEARELAYNLKLPQCTIDEQVRSISPRRTRRRRASYAKTIVTFPKSKRKASLALYRDTPPKSPRHGDHSDLFAREGEDQESFVLSHFERDAIFSEDTCMRCLHPPCECICRSSSHPRSEPECPKCLQQSCTCGHLPELDEAIPAAPPNGNPSFDALKAKLADRTRPKLPKQSITLLAYLARVLDIDDALALLKQLERQPSAGPTITVGKELLDHIQQGIYAGEELDTSGNDDREALRILNVLVQSSRTLTDYSDKLHHEATGGDISAPSVDGCHDGGAEGLDLESSLLNSSPGHEYVPAPPSNPVASVAAFLETQSNVANGAVLQAINTPLAKGVSLYLHTPAPDSSVPHLESSSNIEDAVQPSRFQAGTTPDSATAGYPSRAKFYLGSPVGGELPSAGSHPSGAEIPSTLPAGSPPSSTADLSEQVSDYPIDAEGDTDRDAFGDPLARQSGSKSQDKGNSEFEMRTPTSPRPGAEQLASSILPPSPMPSSKELPKSTPPATPRLGSKKLPIKMNATAQSCAKSPGFGSLPLWPAQRGLPEKAGKEWMSMTSKEALEHAKEEAFSQRKSLAFYLEERRAVRDRIKKENDYANSKWSEHSFFQSSNGVPGSSGTATTSALNKIFDKYRGTSDI